jgi:hypothetical protein
MFLQPKRAVLGTLGLLALLSALPAAAEDQAPKRGYALEELVWMVGCWGSDDEGSSADECWLEPRGNTMMGVHLDVGASGREFYEYLRIVAGDEGIAYMASPMGSEPTPFRLVSIDGQRAVFENLDHDWPQRLTYWREGDALHAQAEGLSAESRKAHWIWPQRWGPVTAD